MDEATERDVAETLVEVKRMSKWEKVLGSSMVAGIVAGIVWVTLTSNTDNQQTQDIKENKLAIQSIRDTLPLLKMNQAVGAKDVQALQKDVGEIKKNQDTDRLMMIDMLKKVSYLYDKEKRN